MKTAVFAFGRMNPPTIGHKKLVDKVTSIPGDHYVFLSHASGNKTKKPGTKQYENKDPLPFSDKLAFVDASFPSVTVGHESVKTVMDAMKKLQADGYTDVVMVAGSDRVNDFIELLNKYQGQEYDFNTIEVISAGERDPDAEGADGMSASKMRAAVRAGDFESFKQGAASPQIAKPMFDMLTKILKQNPMPGDAFNEELKMNEAKLNIKKIHKAVDDGKSMDVIVGMFADKGTTNTDEIRKVVKDYKFKSRIKEGLSKQDSLMGVKDPVISISDKNGKPIDRLKMSIAAKKYKFNMATIRPQFQHQDKVQHGQFTLSAPMNGQPMEALDNFSDEMVDKLRTAYEPLRGQKIVPGPLMKIFDRIDSNKEALEKLYKADIPFVSIMAMSRLMIKHDMKADEINKLGKIRREELELYKEDMRINMKEATPTSEYDYDIKTFFAKVQELEDENQHGEVAKMLTQLYGTSSELMIINGINGMHAKEGSIGPEAQKLRDKISTKYYYQAQKEASGMEEDVNEYVVDDPNPALTKKGSFKKDKKLSNLTLPGKKPTRFMRKSYLAKMVPQMKKVLDGIREMDLDREQLNAVMSKAARLMIEIELAQKKDVVENLYSLDKNDVMQSEVLVKGVGRYSVKGLMQNISEKLEDLSKEAKDMEPFNYKNIKGKLDSGIVTLMLDSLVQSFDDLENARRKGGATARSIPANLFDDTMLQELEITQGTALKVLDNVAGRSDKKPFPIRMKDGTVLDVTPALANEIINMYDGGGDVMQKKIMALLATGEGFKKLIDAAKKKNRTLR